MKIKLLLASVLLALTFPSQATLLTVASDNANNYNEQWLGNGGTGFDNWHFISDNAEGSAGGFMAKKSTNNDLNHITSNPINKAWGSYANGDGFNQFEAYRGFANNSLSNAGDSFKVSFEHGGISQGGAVGFVLRNQNIHNNIGDYNQLSRFEFGFIGGGQHYSIFDGQGVIDTGINFTDAGLNLAFTLLTPDLYQLDIFSGIDNILLQSRNGVLNGSGTIDSVALYNRDAELANGYFNNLEINHAVVVPEPAVGLLMSLALLIIAFRKNREPNN